MESAAGVSLSHTKRALLRGRGFIWVYIYTRAPPCQSYALCSFYRERWLYTHIAPCKVRPMCSIVYHMHAQYTPSLYSYLRYSHVHSAYLTGRDGYSIHAHPSLQATPYTHTSLGMHPTGRAAHTAQSVNCVPGCCAPPEPGRPRRASRPLPSAAAP